MNCSECGSPVLLDRIHGEMVCSSCALVAEPMFDNSPAFDEGGGIVSHGPATGINTGTSLITYISEARRDGRGSRIDERTRANLIRLSKINTRTLGRRDRSTKRLNRALVDIALRVPVPPPLYKRALYIAKGARERGLLPGVAFSVLSAAAVLLAYREAGAHIDEAALADAASISRSKPQRQIGRAYRAIKRGLGVRTVRVTAQTVLPAAAAALGLSPAQVGAVGAELARVRRPRTARADLAACVFVVARRQGWPHRITEIARACGVSDVTIRARVADLAPQYRQTLR